MHTQGVNPHRSQLKERILLTALRLFKEHGIRAVSMSAIASELGMSKRTLYEVYDNKEQLLMDCIEYDHARNIKTMADYVASHDNVMSVVAYCVRLQLNNLSAIHPSLFADMQKYPKVLQRMRAFKAAERESRIVFVKRCVEEGYFRSDLNYDIVEIMNEAVMASFVQRKLYEQYPMRYLFRMLISMHLRGCCTDKGLKYIKDIIEYGE